jgi:hypothetical protein
VINLIEEPLPVLEVGIKIKLYGIRYSNPQVKELIDRKINEIKAEAIKLELAIRSSPEKPIVGIILPLSAYDYG